MRLERGQKEGEHEEGSEGGREKGVRLVKKMGENGGKERRRLQADREIQKSKRRQKRNSFQLSGNVTR